ncbi:protein kinase [Myxococcota bacterium]|nr:protein kinase [Myxococcota bacterium]
MTQISYQLTQKLREGEAYSTYRGTAYLPDGSQRSVVIKLLQPRLASDGVLISHLTGFLDALRSLIHSSLAPIWDFGRAGDLFFLIREYIPGVSLEQLFGLAQQNKASISPALALYLARDIAQAIHLIHKHRVPGDQPIFLFHGGLTPQNIILTRIGDVVITDTGLDVIFWRDDLIVNALRQRKQPYHPPEYLVGQRPLRRGDTYSVAALLYQMLVGLPPQQAAQQWGHAQHFVPPSSQSQRATPELDQLLQHALFPQVEQRLVQVELLLDALKSPSLIRQKHLDRREAMEYIEVLVREETTDPPALQEPLLFGYPFHIESLLPQRDDLPPPHKRYRPPRFEDTDAFHPLQEADTERYHPHLVEGRDLPTNPALRPAPLSVTPLPRQTSSLGSALFVSPDALGQPTATPRTISSPAQTLDESIDIAAPLDPFQQEENTHSGLSSPSNVAPPPHTPYIAPDEDTDYHQGTAIAPVPLLPTPITAPTSASASTTPTAPTSAPQAESDSNEEIQELGSYEDSDEYDSNEEIQELGSYEDSDEYDSTNHHSADTAKDAPRSGQSTEGTVALSIEDVAGYEGDTLYRKNANPLVPPQIAEATTSRTAPLPPSPHATTTQTAPLPTTSPSSSSPPVPSPSPSSSLRPVPSPPPSSSLHPVPSPSSEPIETLEPLEDEDEEEEPSESTVTVPLHQVHGIIAAQKAAQIPSVPTDPFHSATPQASVAPTITPMPPPSPAAFALHSAAASSTPIKPPIPDIPLPPHLLAGAPKKQSSDPQPTQHFEPPEPPSDLASAVRPGQAILEQLEEGQERFGKFVLLGRVALGGMAEVFRAKLKQPDGSEHIVAVKRILPEFSGDANFIQMFKDEARIAGALLHPNIVQIYELGEVDGIYFISMEYIDGIDLARVIKIRRALNMPISPELAIVIGVGVCRALFYAHEEKDANGEPLNMIHRDVTPHNVLISRSGDVKLTDFGIAKASQNLAETAVGELKGKLSYMSPEQAAGYPLDKRSDLFQVGIMLYEILTLQKMFEGKSDQTLLAKIQRGDFPRLHTMLPHLPPVFEQVIMKALALQPNERYQNAHELEQDLLRVQYEIQSPPTAYALAPFVDQIIEQRDALLEQYAQARKQQAKQTFSVWDTPNEAPPLEAPPPSKHPHPSPRPTLPAPRRRTWIYASFALLFLVSAGLSAAYFFYAVPPPEGILSVSTVPPGATVRLDGDILGQSPVEEKRIPFDKDTHVLQIQKDGFEIETKTFQFSDPNTPVQIAVLLQRKKHKKPPTR